MNKELFSFLFISISLVIGAFYYTNTIQTPFIESLNYIKTSYGNALEFTKKNFNKHFDQADEIEMLHDKLQNYENNHFVMQELASEINDLFKMHNSSLRSNPKAELVRVISYETFGNHNRLWINIDDYNSSKIYGLSYKELVAGIVVPKNGRPLALLNKDIKSTYAVHVGNVLAPGIAQGNNDENLIVKYLPAWFNIKEGDEVITSGLDRTFFKGLKVGKVISITKTHGYQTAVVSPYYKSNNPNYFQMIRIQK